MNDQNAQAATISQPTRRRFLGQVALVGGAICLRTSTRALSQEPFDRKAADDSLKGRLFFYGSPRGEEPENVGIFAYDLETRKWLRVLDAVEPEFICRASPDGKWFALNEGTTIQSRVSIVGPSGRTKVSELRGRIFWSPDGRQVVVSEWGTGRPLKTKTWRMNLDGTERVDLPVPENELVLDWSSDGRWLLIARSTEERKRTYQRLIRRADGSDPRPLMDDISPDVWPGRFSPDGRWVVFNRVDQQLKESRLCVGSRWTSTRRERPDPGGRQGWVSGKHSLLVARREVSRRLDVRSRRDELAGSYDASGDRGSARESGIRQLGIPSQIRPDPVRLAMTPSWRRRKPDSRLDSATLGSSPLFRRTSWLIPGRDCDSRGSTDQAAPPISPASKAQ